MGSELVKKETEIKKLHTEVTKMQAFVMEYIMKEEELIREATKAKEKRKTCREPKENTWRKRSCRLKHAKKERKEEAALFE